MQEAEQRESSLKEQLDGHGREKERYFRNSLIVSLLTLFLTNRLLQDASLSSEASSHALEGLKAQLQQVEEQLSQEREAAARAKVWDTSPLLVTPPH